MKKTLFWIFVLVILAAVYGAWRYQQSPAQKEGRLPSEEAADSRPTATTPSAPAYPSYKDAVYIIEDETVALVDGHQTAPAAPGSVASVDTDYFGNEATGDLNGDGVPDKAFILTQSGGGTGIFFYVVAAIKASAGYQGTNAVFLGDRISPQATEIRDGRLIVNYAERRPEDPMTEPPSVGASMFLTIQDGTLKEAAPQ